MCGRVVGVGVGVWGIHTYIGGLTKFQCLWCLVIDVWRVELYDMCLYQCVPSAFCASDILSKTHSSQKGHSNAFAEKGFAVIEQVCTPPTLHSTTYMSLHYAVSCVYMSLHYAISCVCMSLHHTVSCVYMSLTQCVHTPYESLLFREGMCVFVYVFLHRVRNLEEEFHCYAATTDLQKEMGLSPKLSSLLFNYWKLKRTVSPNTCNFFCVSFSDTLLFLLATVEPEQAACCSNVCGQSAVGTSAAVTCASHDYHMSYIACHMTIM